MLRLLKGTVSRGRMWKLKVLYHCSNSLSCSSSEQRCLKNSRECIVPYMNTFISCVWGHGQDVRGPRQGGEEWEWCNISLDWVQWPTVFPQSVVDGRPSAMSLCLLPASGNNRRRSLWLPQKTWLVATNRRRGWWIKQKTSFSQLHVHNIVQYSTRGCIGYAGCTAVKKSLFICRILTSIQKIKRPWQATEHRPSFPRSCTCHLYIGGLSMSFTCSASPQRSILYRSLFGTWLGW